MDDIIKNLLEDVRPFEPSSIGLADCLMVGEFLVHPEPEEPSVCQVCLDFLDGLTDGLDFEQRVEKDICDDNLRVDVGLPDDRIEWWAQTMNDGEVDMTVNLSDEVVFRDQLVRYRPWCGLVRSCRLAMCARYMVDSPSCSKAMTVHTYHFPFSSVPITMSPGQRICSVI